MMRDLLSQNNWFGGLKTGAIIGHAMCLGVAARQTRADEAQLAAIVERLFPERAGTEAVLDQCWPLPLRTVVRFNDHPETTWEDVDKVLTVYEQERRPWRS